MTSQRTTNRVIVLAACLAFTVLTLVGGRTSINEGLGPNGGVYAAMVARHDLQSASAIDKLAPAFPLASAIPYAATGNVSGAFLFVNVLAFAILVLASCLILDQAAARLVVKLCTGLTLVLLGLPTRTSAYDPGQPYLLGVALISLAVASCEWRSPLATGAMHAAATFASPVGLAAPLYGVSRSVRRGRVKPVDLAIFIPAFLLWTFVQFFARGGAAGLVDLVRLSRVRADAAFWTEGVFILFGLYFLLTTLGGLTVLLCSRPAWIKESVIEQPELLALAVPALLFIGTAGLDVPRTFAFLLPFWFLVLAGWARRQTDSLVVPLLLATSLTILTQHPWSRLNDTSYFVDWFPYSVYAGRVNVIEPAFTSIWRVRMFITAGGLAAFLAWARRRQVEAKTGR